MRCLGQYKGFLTGLCFKSTACKLLLQDIFSLETPALADDYCILNELMTSNINLLNTPHTWLYPAQQSFVEWGMWLLLLMTCVSLLFSVSKYTVNTQSWIRNQCNLHMLPLQFSKRLPEVIVLGLLNNGKYKRHKKEEVPIL